MKQSASKGNPESGSSKKSKKGVSVDQPDTAEGGTVDETDIFGGEVSDSDEVRFLLLYQPDWTLP